MNKLPVTSSATLALIQEYERVFQEQLAKIDIRKIFYNYDELPDFIRAVPRRRALVRLENTPVFAIYWYYLLHQDMWCPSFVVWRRHWDLLDTRIVIRSLKTNFGEWYGTFGSTGT